MITQNSVLVAAPMALRLQDREHSVMSYSADFIKALGQISTGAVPLTPENLAIELPKGTDATSDHSQMQALVIDRISDGVNNMFTQIRQYLRPLDAAIRDAVNNIYTPTSAVTAIHDGLYIRYRELELPFFESPLFPMKTPISAFDYENFPVKELTDWSGRFPVMTKEQMDKFMENSSDEMSNLIDWDYVYDVYNSYIVHGNWTSLFGTKGNMLELSNLNTNTTELTQLYFVASRLNAEDGVLDGVTNMTLADYRAYISKILNICIYALQRIRQAYATLAKQTLPIINTKLRDHGDYGVVCGSITVGLTDEAIAKAEAGGYSLSEILTGYVYACDKAPSAARAVPLDDIEGYGALYKEYVSNVQAKLVASAETRLTKLIEAEVNKFQKQHTEFAEYIGKLNDALPYRKLFAAIEPEITQYVNRYRRDVIQGNQDTRDFLATPFTAILVARKLGMTFAASVLERSVVTNDMTLEQQRIKLAEAVAESVAELCLGKHL